MATRKAPDGEDENPAKRQRFMQSQDAVVEPAEAKNTAPSLDDILLDTLVKALSYLSPEDMNAFAMCSRRCREARSNESLNQIRTGVIVCSEQSSTRSIFKAILSGGWNTAFSGNRTHLRIENIEHIEFDPIASLAGTTQTEARLEGVTSLTLSSSPNRRVAVDGLQFLSILPNLKEINFGHVMVSTIHPCWSLGNHCHPKLSITGTGSENCLELTGFGLNNSQNVTELYLDGAHLLSTLPEVVTRMLLESDGIPTFVLVAYRRLERLSLKGTTWGSRSSLRPQKENLSQSMLMKIARKHPTLRWLRSDLSAENMEILKNERPDITLVS